MKSGPEGAIRWMGAAWAGRIAGAAALVGMFALVAGHLRGDEAPVWSGASVQAALVVSGQVAEGSVPADSATSMPGATATSIRSASSVTTAGPVPDSLDGRPYVRLPGERATVYHVPEQRALAERMRDLLDRQSPLPGIAAGTPSGVHAVLAHSPAALDAVIGGVVPEWRAGVAVPALDLLVMPSGEGTGALSGEGARTLRHEWAHLGLHQHLDGFRAPRWFNEGYAEFASGGFDAAEAWRLRVGLAFRRGPVLDSLTLDWPVRREEARLAYLLSASALAYLVEESGVRGLEIFFERWREDGRFEEAFRATYGVTTGQFEGDWRRHVQRRYGWLFVLAHSSVFWLILGIVLVYMVRVRRVYDRERLARLRADEGPDAPAYWSLDEGPWPPGKPFPEPGSEPLVGSGPAPGPAPTPVFSEPGSEPGAGPVPPPDNGGDAASDDPSDAPQDLPDGYFRK